MPRFKWKRILWTSALVGMSIKLYAVDGVVLIDQSRAMAGGVTPGDAPGFPVTISEPGSYRLSGNLTVPDAQTTAVQILADYVTLDLNGFSIAGPAVCTPYPTTCNPSGAGIGVHGADFNSRNPPARGVRVLNGTVRGMGSYGIRLPGEGGVAERVTVHGNGGPGIFASSVFDSMAMLNGGSEGILATIVRGSTAAQNRGNGISVRRGGVALGNSSTENGLYGIVVDRGAITSNSVHNNGNKDVGIDATCPSAVIGNSVTNLTPGSTSAFQISTTGNNCWVIDNAR